MRDAGNSHAEFSIHIHFQRTLWRLLVILLRGTVVITAAIFLALRWLLLPLFWLGKLFFVVVLVNLYKLYLFLKFRFEIIWRPAKNKVLFPLSTRYVIHAVIILLTIFVTTNSLKAREQQQQNTYHPTILSSLLQGGQDDEIIETADAVLSHKTFSKGIGGVSPMDMTVPTEDVTGQVAATQDSSSIVKPSLATTATSDKPRNGVVYHTVEGGETISTIAEQYGISINTILWENRLGPKDYIQPGQRLTILPMTGVSHQVQQGETLASISNTFSADQVEIVTYNKLADASAINKDQIILIPNGRMPAPPTPVQTAPAIRLAGNTHINDNTTAPPSLRAPAGGGLLWPTTMHKINQYYSLRHTGIDIDAEYTSPIYAANSGRVVTAGWGTGYGLHVIIDHGNGMTTVYGHSSKLFVKVGQYVTKGQTIAMAGSTGWSTGVHLHFEVRINGSRMNPFSYL